MISGHLKISGHPSIIVLAQGALMWPGYAVGRSGYATWAVVITVSVLP